MAAIPQNAIPQTQKGRWREVAIEKSGIITDAWSVTKAYLGRLADWILFVCMAVQIVGIVPSITIPTWLSSAVLATQIITLDVAGFGLASLAEHAHQNGNVKEAAHAKKTSLALILIMIITLLIAAAKVLFAKYDGVVSFCDNAETVLILVRVVLVVVYGHVMHSLTGTGAQQLPVRVQDRLETFFLNAQHNIKADVQATINSLLQTIENRFKPENIEMAFSAKINELHTSLGQEITQKIEAQNDATMARIEEIMSLLNVTILASKSEANNEPKNSEITPPILAQNNDQNTPQISELIMSGISWIKTHQNTPPNLSEITPQINEEITPTNNPTNPASNPAEISGVITPNNSADNLDENVLFDEVIMRFPNIASWRSTGQRSVSVEEIIDATNLPKITVSKQAKKPTNKGGFIGTKIKNKYRIMSVISWLKTVEITPIITPTNSAKNNEGNLTENTPLICEEITPVISPKITIKLPTLIDEDFEAEIDQNTMPEKGPNTDELETVIIPESLEEKEDNTLQSDSEISLNEVLETLVLESDSEM